MMGSTVLVLLRRKNKQFRVFSLFLTAAFLIVAGTSGLTLGEKDYYFPEVKVNITVFHDGSFFVDEFRTFDFEGNFSAAWYALPLRVHRQGYRYDVSVEDFRVFDESERPLQAEVSTSGGKLKAEWTFQAKDEQRTFHLQYRVRKGIISYPDVTELYWQVIGEGWERPTRNALITVTLPEAAQSTDDLLVYGHGPLSGEAEIVDARTVRFTAADIPSGQYLEIRLVWPAGIVSGVPSSRSTKSSIREEEARFVRETISRAQKAQEDAQRKKKRFLVGAGAWAVWLVFGSLLWFLIYLRHWKKVGKDYRFPDIPDYYRDLPSDLRPALVEVLLREGGSITPRSFTATLFDLARRGYLEFDDRVEEKSGLFGTREKLETTASLNK
ncbi:MAG: DUF2207 domain-containing protein, partial [Acidobacteriota bacterium]